MPDTAEPRVITPDQVTPSFDWDRAIPAPGISAGCTTGAWHAPAPR
jgi:hypothetical protein